MLVSEQATIRVFGTLLRTLLLINVWSNHLRKPIFSTDAKNDEASTSTTPPVSPKTEQPPSLLPPAAEGSTSDDPESSAVEDADEIEVDEAVFSDEEAEQKEEKSKFKPIGRDEEEAAIRGVDAELDELQNIDNTLLRDNILKLKNERWIQLIWLWVVLKGPENFVRISEGSNYTVRIWQSWLYLL